MHAIVVSNLKSGRAILNKTQLSKTRLNTGNLVIGLLLITRCTPPRLLILGGGSTGFSQMSDGKSNYCSSCGSLRDVSINRKSQKPWRAQLTELYALNSNLGSSSNHCHYFDHIVEICPTGLIWLKLLRRSERWVKPVLVCLLDPLPSLKQFRGIGQFEASYTLRQLFGVGVLSWINTSKKSLPILARNWRP